MYSSLCVKEVAVVPSTLVSNGSVDFRGQIADKAKTGQWKSSPFIIGIQSENFYLEEHM